MAKNKTNYWNKHHESLGDKEKVTIREKLELLCGWSTDTFYRKKRQPDILLSPIEKDAIVKAYDVPFTAFFPNTKPIIV